jgi:hypothetical protein
MRLFNSTGTTYSLWNKRKAKETSWKYEKLKVKLGVRKKTLNQENQKKITEKTEP